jgi:hypothetical protein
LIQHLSKRRTLKRRERGAPERGVHAASTHGFSTIVEFSEVPCCGRLSGLKPLSLPTTRPDVPGNPKGIASSSPGLRGTSYPGSSFRKQFQPQRGCGLPVFCRGASESSRNPVGVVIFFGRFPRVARSSQPWASRRNPVGIQPVRMLLKYHRWSRLKPALQPTRFFVAFSISWHKWEWGGLFGFENRCYPREPVGDRSQLRREQDSAPAEEKATERSHHFISFLDC